MPDKKLMTDALGAGVSRGVGRIFVSRAPSLCDKELLKDTHPWFRVVMRLSGEYRCGYYDGGVKELALDEKDILVTLPGGFLTGRSVMPFTGAQVIFWDKYIRYLLFDNEVTQWRHTANPVRPCGQYIIQSLISMPLTAEFDAARKELVTALLRVALIGLEEDQSAARGKSYNTYHTAVEYIRQNLHLDIDRESAAKACGVTPSHLSRLFRQFGDDNFKDALKKIRLERAEPLLRSSPLTVGEIASLCGFKSATHFIRVFSRFNGRSPGRFRRRG
jgi:AraC-like DNA-binding protein